MHTLWREDVDFRAEPNGSGKDMSKIQARGQLTLPIELRRSAGMEPGDDVTMTLVGPGEIRIKSIKPLSLRELMERFPLDESVVDRDVEEVLEEARQAQADEIIHRLKRDGA